jgi:hypothetical protein
MFNGGRYLISQGLKKPMTNENRQPTPLAPISNSKCPQGNIDSHNFSLWAYISTSAIELKISGISVTN